MRLREREREIWGERKRDREKERKNEEKMKMNGQAKEILMTAKKIKEINKSSKLNFFRLSNNLIWMKSKVTF